MRSSLVFAFATLAACGGSSTPSTVFDFSTKQDFSTTSTNDGSTSGDMATNACTSYTTSTIAAMRQGASGCYELDGVVTVAVSPTGASSTSVTAYVQDAAGGDYSAVRVSCSSKSTAHPCADFSTVKATVSAHNVTIKGTYIKSSAAKGGYEAFYPDSFTDSGAGTLPAPAALTEVDLERGTTTASTSKPLAAYYFQLVTATISDKLLMFDWSSPEFTSSSGTCKQFGFGMIPTSASATAGAACSGTTQPAGQTTINAKEVLVGTDFYEGFTDTTDCVCGPMYKDPVPTTGQGVTGSVTVLLNYDVPYNATTGYVYVDPLTNAQFPIQ